MLFLRMLFILLLTVPVSWAQKQERPPAKVKIAKVTEKNIAKNANLIGVLYFDKVSNVSTQVAGMVQAVYFHEGARVKKGETLIKINTDFLDQDIAFEKTRIEQIDVRIKKTQKNLERFKKLLKNEAVSEVDYDNLNFLLLEQIKEREMLQQGISKIKLQLSKCLVTAPFDGIILEKKIDVGNWVIPGGMLCRIGAVNDLFVKVALSEKLVRFNPKNKKVKVVLNAFGNELEGKITGIMPIADQKTKNVFLKIRLGINAMTTDVAENMSATVYISTGDQKKMKIIPRDALINSQGQNIIYTIKDNKASVVAVKTVVYLGADLGVTGPEILIGMQVIVDGNERLQPDQPVVITGE